MASGRPDWYSNVVMSGKYNTTYVPVAVDINGNMIALMQGDFGGVLKNIAVDANGIMKANLAVQDLDAVQVRPLYTETLWDLNEESINAGFSDTLLTITGQGIILGGFLYTKEADYHDASRWYIEADGVEIADLSLAELKTYGIKSPVGIPLFILTDIPGSDSFYLGINPNMTFESNFVFKAKNDAAEANDIFGVYVWYALTP